MSFFKDLVNKGVPEGHISTIEKKRIIIINIILLLAMTVSMIKLISFLYLEIYLNVLISSISFLIFTFALRMNHTKRYDLAKYY